jgi:four helix bundle protein
MGSDIKSYKDLIIWQKSIKLVKDVYQLVHKFPKHETYALSDQLRRSVVSIPSNIAEGQARQYPAEFRQFLYTALGSAAEVDTQIIIALELNYISKEEANNIAQQIIEIRKMAYAIIQRLPKAQN